MTPAVLLNILLDLFQGLLAVEAEVTVLLRIDTKTILENDDDGFDVELLVINNQNSLFFIDRG